MESVKRNSDRQQNVEMRRLIDDSGPCQQPLEILEQEISVLEKTEHAQIHANARDQPALLGQPGLRFGNLAAEPEIHRRSREKQRGERRIPRAVKNIAGDDEQIFSQLPAAKTPVEREDNDIKDNKSERVKKHGTESRGRRHLPIFPSHIEANVLEILFGFGKEEMASILFFSPAASHSVNRNSPAF